MIGDEYVLKSKTFAKITEKQRDNRSIYPSIFVVEGQRSAYRAELQDFRKLGSQRSYLTI